MSLLRRLARRAGLVLLFVLAAMLGIASGVLFAFAGDLPAISALDDYAPSTISRVYGAGGEIVGEFAIQRREVIPYEAIPPTLKQAILAAEDADFERHFGLSIPRIIVTVITDIIYRRMHGASTLTQQLARKLFLTDDKTPERKIKEAILAIQIEKRYTKNEIFTLYCNQMYFGHGVYGVEAASRLYFGKSVRDLALEEAALIAGILQGNVRQSPYVNMEAALRRRNYALSRMAEVGFITPEAADAARKKPIVVRDQPPTAATSIAPYFVEEVRKELEQKYGAKQLYENGLSIQTGLDLRLQEAANAALEEGLRRVDKRRGWRKPSRNVVTEGHSVDGFRQPRWDRPMRVSDIVPAVVSAVDGAAIQLRAGTLRITIDRKGYAWTNRKSPAQLVTRGDLVEARLTAITDDGRAAAGTLEQPPAVEGAALAIDNRTGQIRAMVGGYSFDRSKFNRATQAYRQVGSAFKPIVYTAAIDRGYTPVTLLMDAPASFSAGAGQPAYTPHNYDRKFEGPVTLRHALEQSRNVPAVRVMEQLGPQQVIAYARRLGLESPLPPYLSVALGAAEATLQEMTSAYSVFPNQGVRMRPYAVLKVSDREGNVLEDNRPEPRDAIRADTAFVMTNLLRGVVQRGTGARAAALKWPIGGKTGTTDDYTDAWFIGFDPDLTIGVWIGYDQKRTMGPAGTGSDTALPIWNEIMKAWIGDRTEPPTFEPPGNIVFAAVNRGTGDAVAEGTEGAITEAFIAGTQPGSGFR
ncbi:MAG TPA: PBP1A family penicillin-binding protein [Vicinamibacterales bacterium]|nr:PBP1A family penicillin-binding protein [Vicinamibacterales bacterium]